MSSGHFMCEVSKEGRRINVPFSMIPEKRALVPRWWLYLKLAVALCKGKNLVQLSAPTSCPTAFRLLQGAVRDMESEGIQPSTMVSGYFNNGKWILQASQFERQARQFGVRFYPRLSGLQCCQAKTDALEASAPAASRIPAARRPGRLCRRCASGVCGGISVFFGEPLC